MSISNILHIVLFIVCFIVVFFPEKWKRWESYSIDLSVQKEGEEKCASQQSYGSSAASSGLSS